MNIKRSRVTAVMTLIISLLALYSSIIGVFDKNLYEVVKQAGTISQFLLVGSIAQDIISIPIAVALVILSFMVLTRPGYKTFIAALGIVWYFFYGYGLYVLQGQYTSLYLIYLAIFGLSIYSLILGVLSFDFSAVRVYALPGALRKLISAFLITILVVLVPLWIAFSSVDIAKHVPRDTYGVFILDLAIVFPALGIIAVQLLRNKPLGILLSGIALLKAFTLCLSVGFGEWFQSFYGGNPLNTGGLAIFSVLSAVGLLLFIPYILKLKCES